MQVEKNTVVSMHYTLTDFEGDVIDTTQGEEPLKVLIGARQVLPAFEKELMGLNVGDKKQFVLSPEQGYGEYDEDLVQVIERQDLKDIDSVEEGDILDFEDEDGNMIDGEVIEIDGDKVTIDFNHELAGEELHYHVEIVDVRQATAEEIAHGHVH